MLADEFDVVSLVIATDDSAWTATTSGGDAFDEPIIHYKWSLKAGRLSRLAGEVPRRLPISF